MSPADVTSRMTDCVSWLGTLPFPLQAGWCSADVDHLEDSDSGSGRFSMLSEEHPQGYITRGRFSRVDTLVDTCVRVCYSSLETSQSLGQRSLPVPHSTHTQREASQLSHF